MKSGESARPESERGEEREKGVFFFFLVLVCSEVVNQLRSRARLVEKGRERERERESGCGREEGVGRGNETQKHYRAGGLAKRLGKKKLKPPSLFFSYFPLSNLLP